MDELIYHLQSLLEGSSSSEDQGLFHNAIKITQGYLHRALKKQGRRFLVVDKEAPRHRYPKTIAVLVVGMLATLASNVICTRKGVELVP